MGLFLLLAFAWALSTNRKLIPWRVIGWGLGIQLVFAVLILKTAPGTWLFKQLNTGVMKLLSFTEEGSRFIFGNLVDNDLKLLGKDRSVPFDAGTAVSLDGHAELDLVVNNGSFFAFNVLPTIIFFSALMAVLYHLGVMQLLVRGMAWIMFKTMGTSGAETLSAAANVFVGQTEAPLVVRPFVDKMTLSELHAIMTAGFATVAGGVLAAYVALLSGIFPDIAGHLIAASVLSAPAALVVSKIMWPETGQPATANQLAEDLEQADDKPINTIDAAARGASQGMKLALNVAAMLLAFIALVALVNGLVGAAGDGVAWIGAGLGIDFLNHFADLTLETLVGYIFWPLAWAMGVPAAECSQVGQLLGIKTILNEFYAYFHLKTVAGGLSERSMVITTYALCGFANLGSIGIQLGGIGGIAPPRRGDLARVGFRAMIAGTLAAFMTANIAGALVG
ncbi:MAG: nucleoside transporter C-terminal domain-containing protein [Myxococcota bacterium]|nr:nucleoside transporter C-terminal domain-containing protein [Myxococcota bacterium]